ncbi:MAG TPA: DUF2310 family Zn-ribbon-containing protein [Pirellulales bacterium]|nr:DUF2310 family Zn-ribbon-containing protein [Pirellulales bacterium]
MAAAPDDPYSKLRPAPPTPDEEICHCAQLGPIALCDQLSDNPLRCLVCKGEVAPERLGFDQQLAEAIANWRSVYRSLYLLWLDSGQYEAWAAEMLSDPCGQVNRTGRELVERLGAIVPAYYWWFLDVGADDYAPSDKCPICGTAVSASDGNPTTCEACRIAF